MTIVHTAGEPQGLVQACSHCGYLLSDHRNTWSPEGSGPLGYWEVGDLIAVIEGNPRHSFPVTHVSIGQKGCSHQIDNWEHPKLVKKL